MPVPIRPITSPDFSRMAELNRILSLAPLAGVESGESLPGRPRCQYPVKRANWLKFCRKCGVDISKASAYVRLCGKCEQEFGPLAGLESTR